MCTCPKVTPNTYGPSVICVVLTTTAFLPLTICFAFHIQNAEAGRQADGWMDEWMDI